MEQSDYEQDAPSSPKTKRITIPVSPTIDEIREQLKESTGIEMTYTQIFNFLIHFYVEHKDEPQTKWRSWL